MTKLQNNQVIKIKTVRNVFGQYQGLAKVTLKKNLDDIWTYNGFIGIVELLEPHNLGSKFLPIEASDIVKTF